MIKNIANVLTKEEQAWVIKSMRSCMLKKKKCAYYGCKEKMIGGHFYSNGILKGISDDTEKVCLLEHHAFSESAGVSKAFKLIGRHQVRNTISASLRWFCADHDHNIFKPVECFKNEIDFSKAKNCNLILLKCTLKELHGVNVWIQVYKKFKGGSELEKKIFEKMKWQSNLQQFCARSTILHMRAEHIISCISSGDQAYNYVVFRFNKSVEFYFNAIMPILNTKWGKPVLEKYFISFMPFKDSSILFLGGNLPKMKLLEIMSDTVRIDVMSFFERIFKLDMPSIINVDTECMEEDLMRFLNYCVLKGSRPFCCSPDFYKKNILPKEKSILAEMNRVWNNYEVPQVYIFGDDNTIPYDRPVIMAY